MLIPDLNDIPELAPVEEGEYDIRVTRAKEIKSKSTGRKAIFLACEIVGEENADDLLHSIWLPMDSDAPGKANTMWRMIKEFITAVGLPLDGIDDISVFEDLEFNALLGKEEAYGDSGQIVNVIKRVV